MECLCWIWIPFLNCLYTQTYLLFSLQEWRRRCQIKTNFYSSLTAYYAGINEEENKVYGKAIAWFQLANNHMEECKTNAKNFKDSDNLSMMASGGTYRASAIYAGEVISNK